ncbi:A24 family peptidase [Oceanobacillus profundus]|uniref:A24 family peptidase n=2 Tax=Oceanobacillus TaxID=182709 RepID=UPI0026E13297|nr:prepilin peptidase [Oceanobacillus profundus]MDO6448213.1 prepilin peptidase [Oceanobacillus profundus]
MLQMNDYFLFLFIIIAFLWDIRIQKIPNWLTAGGMLLAFILHLITNGIDGFLFSVFGLIVATVVCLVLYGFKAIGAGDVKLFAAIGGFVGIQIVLYILMYSIVCGGVIGILLLIITRTKLYILYNKGILFLNRKWDKQFAIIDKESKIISFPFMYAVLPGVILTYTFLFI